MNRLISALFSTGVSSLIFSTIMYTPVSQRQPNTWYDPFGSGLPVYLIIFASVYIIGGIPCSLLIDKFTKKTITRLIAYLIAGLVVGIATILILISFLSGSFVGVRTLFAFGSYGSVGALIYYSILSLLDILKGKNIWAKPN